jgi:putative transposase
MYNGPERKALRLRDYDYSQDGCYFVTICTKHRENYFWEIVDGAMILNDYGRIAENCWREVSIHYQNVEIDEFTIMPNHIHGIIKIPVVGNEYFRSDQTHGNETHGNEDIRPLRDKSNISNVIKWFKIWCTKEIRWKYEDYDFSWQKSFYDVIIRNDDQLNKTRQYIIDNPLKWELDKNNPVNIKPNIYP